MSNTKLNALALYANFIVLGLLGLLINPLMVRALGVEQFGIWKACLRLLDLAAAADGRASQALKWIVAHRDQEGDLDKQRDTGAALLIWLLWMPILMIAVAAMIVYLPQLVSDISVGNLSNSRLLAGLLGFNIVLSGLLGISDATLVGTNQGYRSYSLSTTFLVVSNIAMLLAAREGYGLVGIGAATVMGTFFNGIATWLVARRFVSWWGIALPRRSDITRVLSFSNLTMVGAMIQSLMLSTEVLVIGFVVGPEAVSHYVFSSYISTFVLSICLMTGTAVTPKLGAMIGRGDSESAAALQDRAREALLVVTTVGAVGLVLCNRPFVESWAGPAFYLGDMVNFNVVAVMVQLVLIRFDFQLQDIGLRIGPKVIWSAVTSVLAILLGATLYWTTGSLPMLFVGIILGRLPLIFVFPRMVSRIIPGHSRQQRGTIAMLITIAATFALSQVWNVSGWVGFAEAALAALALGGSASLLFVVTAGTRRHIVSQVRDRLRQRFAR
jgi:O-antigen/teichoic acid export membrane protein